jgi:hypothetical protein
MTIAKAGCLCYLVLSLACASAQVRTSPLPYPYKAEAKLPLNSDEPCSKFAIPENLTRIDGQSLRENPRERSC